MSKTLSADLRAYMNGEDMVLAVCVKIRRLDGEMLGFTTYDQDISYDYGDGDGAVVYGAANAVLGSAVRQSVGSGVDNLDVMGMLASDSITEVDLYAGRYDSARVVMFYLAPSDTAMGHMTILSGILGEVKWQDGQFTVEHRSLSQFLTENVGENTSPTCRAELGDSRCRVDMTGVTLDTGDSIRSTGTVTEVVSQHSFRMSGIVSTAGFYTQGKATFITGPNAGIEREVKAHGVDAPIVFITTNDLAALAPVPWSPSACGVTFNFAIPAGVWESGYVLVSVRSARKTYDGRDSMWIRVPLGDEYSLGDVGSDGDFNLTVPSLSPASMTAINAAAGGNLSCCIRHGTLAATQAAFVSVISASLRLLGQPASVSNLLVFGEPFPFTVGVGDTATVEAGCNKLIATCNSRFKDPDHPLLGNVANFRGEPYIPGNDQLIRVGRH